MVHKVSPPQVEGKLEGGGRTWEKLCYFGVYGTIHMDGLISMSHANDVRGVPYRAVAAGLLEDHAERGQRNQEITSLP